MKLSTSEKIVYWQSRIGQWESSGQTQSAYCHKKNLILHQFIFWKNKLKVAPENESPIKSSDKTFIPVVIDPHSAATGLVLHHLTGFRIEGIADSTLGLARQLLEMLRCRCASISSYLESISTKSLWTSASHFEAYRLWSIMSLVTIPSPGSCMPSPTGSAIRSNVCSGKTTVSCSTTRN